MRARFVCEFLNEELVSSISWSGKDFEIYKNPKTVKRMDYWARAMSTDNGDFYIITFKYEQITSNYDDIIITHTELADWLRDNVNSNIKYTPFGDKSGYGYYPGAIAWQRYNNSDKWYISESTSHEWIERNEEYIKKSINKINEHNIHYLRLIPSRISKTYDNPTEFKESDEYYREQEKYMY